MLTLVEFQGLTTAAQGRRMLLTEMLEVRILPGEPTPVIQQATERFQKIQLFDDAMSSPRITIKRD